MLVILSSYCVCLLFYRAGGNQLICSGPDRGTCDCGCVCADPPNPGQIITGLACECNNYECPESHDNDNGIACRGVCEEWLCFMLPLLQQRLI